MTLTEVCNWPHSGCPACEEDGLECLNPAQQDEVTAWVKSDLWEATGRVYGTCPVSVLPCNESICGLCRHRLRDCGCRTVPEIRIPGPVAEVTAVVIDGVELDNSAYRIDDYEWLVRLDGGTWPTNSDPVDPDSFRVDYLKGINPPNGAGLVTGILACERAKAICGDKTCRLPRSVQQVTRQGVTMVRGGGVATSSRPWRYEPDSVAVFGLDEVDEWVRNANATTLAGAVHSPDIPHVRQITWEALASP